MTNRKYSAKGMSTSKTSQQKCRSCGRLVTIWGDLDRKLCIFCDEASRK